MRNARAFESMKRPKDPDIARRIGEAIAGSGKNPHAVSIEMGIAYSTVHNWAKGTSEPSASLLREFARICEVSADWILTGEGPRSTRAPSYPSREKFLGSNHGLDGGDRIFLANLDLGPEDPGGEAWPMLLNVRRQLRKQREAATKPTARD